MRVLAFLCGLVKGLMDWYVPESAPSIMDGPSIMDCVWEQR